MKESQQDKLTITLLPENDMYIYTYIHMCICTYVFIHEHIERKKSKLWVKLIDTALLENEMYVYIYIYTHTHILNGTDMAGLRFVRM